MNKYSNSLKIVKCRGIIMDEDKLLLVRHGLHHNFYALPGGHLEGEENPVECIERELLEEFGVKADVGRLLYICQFADPGKSFIEFFFEIKNGADFKNLDESKIDKNEIVEVVWVSKNDNLNILPVKLKEDLKNGILGKTELQFIR